MVINGGERAEISIGHDPTAPRRSPPSSPSQFTLHLAKLEGNIGASRQGKSAGICLKEA